jgi:hypothetical protein
MTEHSGDGAPAADDRPDLSGPHPSRLFGQLFDRDVLLLTSWAGLDSNEVAEALGLPVCTVRSRLHRVRRLRASNTEHTRSGDERRRH